MANSIAVIAAVAGDGREDADADGEALGAGQRGRRQADAGGVEAVLDHPQLVDTAGIEPLGERGDQAGRELTREAHADAHGACSHDGTAGDMKPTGVWPPPQSDTGLS